MAERIADRLDNDGLRWTTREGTPLEDMLDGATATSRDGSTRYTMSDGSVITTQGGGWDLGYQDCYCWQGVGHSGECAAREDM